MIDKGIEAVLLAETKNDTSVEQINPDMEDERIEMDDVALMEDEGIEMDDVALSDIGPLELVSRTETEATSYCSSSKRKKLTAAIIIAIALLAVAIVFSVGILSENKSGPSSSVLASANGALTLEDCLASVVAEEVVEEEEEKRTEEGGQVEESVEEVADEEEEEEESEETEESAVVSTTRIPTRMPTTPVPIDVPTDSPDVGTDQAVASLNETEETGEKSELTAIFDKHNTSNNATDLNVEAIPQQQEKGVSNSSNDIIFSKHQHVVMAVTSNKVDANGGNSNDNGVDGFLVRRDLRGSSSSSRDHEVGGLKLLVDPSSKSRRLQCEKLLADQATRANSSAKSDESPKASKSSTEDIRRMLRRS